MEGTEDIDKRAKELVNKIKERDEERKRLASSIPRILILGDYDHIDTLQRIRDGIKKEGHYAFLLNEIDPYLDGVTLGDISREEKAIEFASIILMIESDKAGVVSENIIIKNNPEYAQKVTLFVKENDFEEITRVDDERRVHHRSIIVYKDEEDLIKKAVRWGIKECYRIADEEILKVN